MPPEFSADSTLDPAARQILRSYPRRFQPRVLSFLHSGGGFSGARLWRVEGEDGVYALRAMPCATVNVARLQGLHRLLAHVRDSGAEAIVAVPVLTTDGTTFAVLDGFVWQLEPWLPGMADFSLAPSPVRLRNALRALARWHVAAKSFVPAPIEEQWFGSRPSARSPGIFERIQRIEHWTSEQRAVVRASLMRRTWPDFDELGLRILELFPGVAPSVVQQLRLGSTISVPLQPCLRDIWHDHVLFSGEEVTGLIDAHSCRTDCVATDLARLLGSLVADDREAWDDGLEAYGKVRPLALDERSLMEVFDQSAVLLNGLTWIEWRCVERRSFANPQTVALRLRGIVSRLETLSRRI